MHDFLFTNRKEESLFEDSWFVQPHIVIKPLLSINYNETFYFYLEFLPTLATSDMIEAFLNSYVSIDTFLIAWFFH